MRGDVLARAVEWLRAGYPTGVPRQDYVVLLGLLRRRLTDDEIHRIARQLADLAADGDPITTADIERMIDESVLQPATPEEVERVSAHLAADGWPLIR